MIRSYLRKICFDKDIRSIAELQRITDISRPTLYKLYDDKDVHTVKLEIIEILCDKLELKSISELIEITEN